MGYCGCERKLVVGPYTGPSLDFDPADFSQLDLSRPRGSWNNPKDDLDVLHTFRPEVPEGCCVSGGQLRVAVKREGRVGLSNNDGFVVTTTGGARLYSESIWEGAFTNATSRTIDIQLDAAMVEALSQGSLSFFVSDDTTALWTELTLTMCCSGATAELTGLNSCSGEPVETKPWGVVTIPIYSPDDRVLVDTEGSCVDGDGYFIGLEEFDPITWTAVTPIFSGWVSHRGPVPEIIDIATFLPPQHRSPSGGFKSGIVYGFKLAVAAPWDEAHYHFRIS